MWIWEGVICPEPGESIDNAAKQAIALAKVFKAAPRPDKYQYFTIAFNDIELKIYRDSTVKEVVNEYFKLLYGKESK
jgi:hypothetical protein